MLESHSWQLSPTEAVEVQRHLREQVVIADRFPWPLGTVAGADISYDQRTGMLFAAVLTFSYPGLTLLSVCQHQAKSQFPYLPGLLSFREGPLLAAILSRLSVLPDLLVSDGQGIAHPRGLGLASHLGILFDLPTIGCAKKRLVGTYRMPGEKKGSMVPLMGVDNRQIGMVVRTRDRVKPVFVSPGHRISVATAAALILQLTGCYRLPEVTRQAHHHVNRMRQDWLAAHPFRQG
ncbi:MAG: endonuclease V [Deltaproteobacteria bacterium]|nr:endonuclease V [Candidatus Anaeroferrophillus wilburensis]MBN2890029.1 endonuclease V [Deltaproteobacteria bacterium]